MNRNSCSILLEYSDNEGNLGLLINLSWTDVSWLSDAVVELDRIGAFSVPELLVALSQVGGFPPDLRPKDKMVAERLARWTGKTANDISALRILLAAVCEQADQWLLQQSAVLLPTRLWLPPEIRSLDKLDARIVANDSIMSITRSANVLNLPAIALPLPTAAFPTSPTVLCRAGYGSYLLGISMQIERAIRTMQTPKSS